MHDFILSAVKNLGISEGTAEGATGGLLQVLQQNAQKGDFDELLAKLPGAAALLTGGGAGAGAAGEPAAGGTIGGGMLGGLVSKAATAIGGNVGSGLGVAAILERSGLPADKLGPFVSMFMSFIRSQAGAQLVDRLLGQVPQLKALMG